MRYFGQEVRRGKRGGLYVNRNNSKRYLRQHEKDLVITPEKLKYRTPFPAPILRIILEYKAQLEAPKEATFFLLLSRMEREFIVHSFFEFGEMERICCHELYKYAKEGIFVPKRIEKKLVRSALHY